MKWWLKLTWIKYKAGYHNSSHGSEIWELHGSWGRNVFSEDLQSLGVILSSHKPSIFQMSHWKQALDIGVMRLTFPFDCSCAVRMKGAVWQLRAGVHSEVGGLRDRGARRSSVKEHAISSWSLHFLVHQLERFGRDRSIPKWCPESCWCNTTQPWSPLFTHKVWWHFKDPAVKKSEIMELPGK